MVLQKRLDYGFNGYEVPHTPRAARSPRKSAFKKKSDNHQISSFDLLAAVAGKLLLEGGNSSSSSNNNEDQCAVKKEPLNGSDLMVEEETNCDHDNNPERSFFVSEILPKPHDLQTFNRSPSPLKEFHFGSSSGITSDSSEKFETQELAYDVTKMDNGDCYKSESSNDKKSMLGGLNFEAKLSRNVVAKDEHHIGSGFKKAIPQNPSVCSDDIDLRGRENDDDENMSARYTTKSFRSTLRIGDRRIRKVLASKYCKVSPNPKDTTVTNSDLDLKHGYYSKKHCLRSLRSERNYPIKKRRYFDGYKAPQYEETAKNEGISGSSPRKGIIES